MMMHAWPALEPVPVLDLKELRSALATKGAARLVAAVAGRDIDDALQQVGSGMLLTLRQNHEYAEPLALSVINRLTWRGGPGDRILAEDLLATLRGVPLQGRVLPVDLEMLSILLEGAPELSTGAYLDLRTGAVYGGNETDPMMVGEDAAIDVDKGPDRWIYLAGVGSREGWRDMAAFAERQPTSLGESDWSGRSRAGVPSADSATSLTTKASPSSGTSSHPIGNWVVHVRCSPPRASAGLAAWPPPMNELEEPCWAVQAVRDLEAAGRPRGPRLIREHRAEAGAGPALGCQGNGSVGSGEYAAAVWLERNAVELNPGAELVAWVEVELPAGTIPERVRLPTVTSSERPLALVSRMRTTVAVESWPLPRRGGLSGWVLGLICVSCGPG
ncbi:hypothetical protein [Microbacterium sp.]|uniref:hypothetical protein n=1 Tax=Microbacterium sp. TaxID=51671 RepID=UPI003C2755E4